MADYGVTPLGFVRPRMPEIRQEIIDDLRARLRASGLSDDIQTRPDSVIGLLVDTFAERETALWELSEGVYFAMYPGSAVGAQLDRAASFSGVVRQAAVAGNVDVVLYGTSGTVVPAGAQLRNRHTQTVYTLDSATTIGLSAVADATISITTIANSTAYTATINSTAYTYTSDASATMAEIAAGLASALAPSGLTVTQDGASVRVVYDGLTSFTLAVSTNLSVSRVGTPSRVTATDFVSEEIAVNSITEIVTLQSGLSAVDNLVEGVTGNAAETDAELRSRYALGVFRLGAATLEAVRANLLANVPGLSYAYVAENITNAVDAFGRLPHSVHAIVDGGADADVAAELFRVVAAGIDYNGAVSVPVTDSHGTIHAIKFDRPQPVYVWVKVSVTLLPSSEEQFPADGYQQVVRSIVETGNKFGIGMDIVWQRLLASAHKVAGVSTATLTIATGPDAVTPPAPGNYVATNIAIGPAEIGAFDAARVEVL